MALTLLPLPVISTRIIAILILWVHAVSGAGSLSSVDKQVGGLGRGSYRAAFHFQAAGGQNSATQLKLGRVFPLDKGGALNCAIGPIANENQVPARAANTKTGSAEAFYSQGKDYADGGHFEEAIPCFTQAIRLKPDFADAFKARSLAYMYVHKDRGALLDMSRAIQLRPGDADAVSMRGSFYFQFRDYDRAIRDFTRSIQLDPKEWFTFWARGGAYYDKGDYDAAIRDYDEVISRRCTTKVKDFAYYSQRGLAYLYKGDYEKAIRDFNAVADQQPSWCCYHRGLAHFFMGQFRAAKEDLTRFEGAEEVLWLYLVESKLGEKAKEGLQESASGNKWWLKVWPSPVIQYYLGSITSAQLLSMARAGYGLFPASACCDDDSSAHQRIPHYDIEGAAYFYIAERLLISGHSEQAEPLLQKAQQMADRNSPEYRGSCEELKRLGATPSKEQPPK